MTQRTSCYVCRSPKTVLFKEVNNLPIYKCGQCGLLWVREKDQTGSVQDFYQQEYFHSQNKYGYKDYESQEASHRRNASLIFDALGKIKKFAHTRVLDIGCAHGFLLDEARRRHHCEVTGIEPSDYARNYAVEKLHLNIYRGPLDDCPEGGGVFDVIFLIGVIEHLPAPRKMLEMCRNLLKQDGIIVITTVDTRGYFPFYMLKPPEHVFYFSHANLNLLLEQCGYKTLLTRTHRCVYSVCDLFFRLRDFFSMSFWGMIGAFFLKQFPNWTVKIPTNEMFVVCGKH